MNARQIVDECNAKSIPVEEFLTRIIGIKFCITDSNSDFVKRLNCGSWPIVEVFIYSRIRFVVSSETGRILNPDVLCEEIVRYGEPLLRKKSY